MFVLQGMQMLRAAEKQVELTGRLADRYAQLHDLLLDLDSGGARKLITAAVGPPYTEGDIALIFPDNRAVIIWADDLMLPAHTSRSDVIMQAGNPRR